MIGKQTYSFSGVVWQYPAVGGWYFVSLPTDMTEEIRKHLNWLGEGWGRLRVTAKAGSSSWETAIWFDKKHCTYLLPIKAEIRKKESIAVNHEIVITLWI